MPGPVRVVRCARFVALERRARAILLRWIAAGAVIDEAHDTALDDDEVAAISAAIEAARRAGR